jgi:GxxExxY protein
MNPQISQIDTDSRDPQTHAIIGAALEVPIDYKGRRLSCKYRADFVCYENVIVELKALQALTGFEEAQLLNYLKATRLERGLLLNFGRPSLEFKRFILS